MRILMILLAASLPLTLVACGSSASTERQDKVATLFERNVGMKAEQASCVAEIIETSTLPEDLKDWLAASQPSDFDEELPDSVLALFHEHEKYIGTLVEESHEKCDTALPE